MNKKLLSYLTVLIMIGNYTSATMASNSSSNNLSCEISTSPRSHSNEDDILYDLKNMENGNLDDSKKMSTNNSDNNKVVDYDEDTMWFDYQALFDKTKNVVLGQNDESYVNHVDFKKDDLARNSLLLGGYYDNKLITRAINGNIASQYIMMDNCANYLFGGYGAYNNISLNSEQESIIDLNYRYLVGIIASLAGNQLSDVTNEYRHLARFNDPDFLNNIKAENANLYDVMDLII